MENTNQENRKKLGTISFLDNKVRINYSDGTDSVLFEDISSISYKSIDLPNVLVFFLCLILGMAISIFASNLYLLIPSCIVAIILMFVLRIKFDNVIIETRGGKLLYYSVIYGQGKEQMELIETEKRKLK